MRFIGIRTPNYRRPLRIVHPSPHQLSPSFLRSIMSAAPSTSTTHPSFASIFDAALESYKRKTKKDLASHPLLPSLQSCDSPEAILTVLREQIPASDLSQNHDDGLTKWVAPTVNVLHSFSESIGQGVGLVNISYSVTKIFSSNIYFQAFSPATVIFTGISILLSVQKLMSVVPTSHLSIQQLFPT